MRSTVRTTPARAAASRLAGKGSSLRAPVEAAKAADLVGCSIGCDEETSDADMAYIQAPFDDSAVETYVALPQDRWPQSWHDAVARGEMVRPVVRLCKALYGHPDAGTMWEAHADEHLRAQGFESLLDYGWQSCHIHRELALFLVIYVDDFKLAGKSSSLHQGGEIY